MGNEKGDKSLTILDKIIKNFRRENFEGPPVTKEEIDDYN